MTENICNLKAFHFFGPFYDISEVIFHKITIASYLVNQEIQGRSYRAAIFWVVFFYTFPF